MPRLTPLPETLHHPIEHIDVDVDPKYAELFGVSGLPTVILLQNGTEEARYTGTINRAELKNKVEELK